MQPEAYVPSHGALPLGGDVPEDLHAVLSPAMYDRDTSAVHETYAWTSSETCEVQEHDHRHQASRHDLHEAAAGECPGEEMPPVNADAIQVVVPEVTVCVEVEADRDGDDPGIRHHAFPASPSGPVWGRKCVFSISLSDSLQKSSAIQKISLILSSVIMIQYLLLLPLNY